MPTSILIILIVIFSLALVWLPVMMIAVLFSGWWELARRYPARKPQAGAQRGIGSVYFTPLFRYKNFVAYSADDDHLHLRLPPLLGALHAPMSIPWHSIELPTDQPAMLGMVHARIDGKRIFIAKAMAKRELEIRTLIPDHQLNNADTPLDAGLPVS